MKLRRVRAGADDPAVLASFACSSGSPFDDDVERWVQTTAIGWANDVPRATFQRRGLAIVDDEIGAMAAVVAWQDITRVDLDGVLLECLAVNRDHQHRGCGREVLDATMEHLRGIDHDGNHVAGLVHPDNTRGQRLLASAG